MRTDGRHMPWIITAALVAPNRDDILVIRAYGDHLMTPNSLTKGVVIAASIVNTYLEQLTEKQQ